MKLYNYFRSSSSWRVRIALSHKSIPYEYVPVHLVKDGGAQHSPEFRALNPTEQIPLLEITEDGATHRIGQSLAIIEYLEERFPEPSLLPQDPFKRALVRQLAENINSGIQPFQNLTTMAHVKTFGADGAAFAAHFIQMGLSALEALSAPHAGVYLVGDMVTLADVCLIPQLHAARRFNVPLDTFSTLLRVESACLALDAFTRSHPDAQPDAPEGKP